MPIVPSAEDTFTEEQKAYIPRLSDEFVLPVNLHSICNAVAAADMLAVLFHGPAGTGKTMSYKLICQAIGLPIMETINCTENLDVFVLGKYIPQDDRIIFRGKLCDQSYPGWRCGSVRGNQFCQTAVSGVSEFAVG